MYYPNAIEEICFKEDHIQKVLGEIKRNIPDYFEKYVSTDAGQSADDEKLAQLAAKFGSTPKRNKKKVDKEEVLVRIVKEAIKSFESDREAYQDHLHPEALEEYAEDVGMFKNTVLKNQIPIVRKTLQNKAAKELDKYRSAFNASAPGDLFEVTNNIVELAQRLRNEWYNNAEFENITNHSELGYGVFDDEKYIAYGVIGGGIKSHFIHKLHPEMFPNRSRESIWALWYLSDKKHFGCKEDSQFLMINQDHGQTQQNYFYPYGLFSFYALEIYRELRSIFKVLGAGINEYERFIIVENFLSFVARQHQDEIDILKQKSDNLHYDYH